MPPITDITWGPEQQGPMGNDFPQSGIIVPPGAGVMSSALGASAPTPVDPSTDYVLTLVDIGLGQFTYSNGVSIPAVGALTPLDYNGFPINRIQGFLIGAPLFLVMDGIVTQDFFTTLTIDGTPMPSASASFGAGAGLSIWEFPFQPVFAAGTYAMNIS